MMVNHWLVVSHMTGLFSISSARDVILTTLTKSIIFQDGRYTTETTNQLEMFRVLKQILDIPLRCFSDFFHEEIRMFTEKRG